MSEVEAAEVDESTDVLNRTSSPIGQDVRSERVAIPCPDPRRDFGVVERRRHGSGLLGQTTSPRVAIPV